MRKSIAVLIATLLAVTLSVTQLMAAVIPPIGLAPGSQYELVFVTDATRNATSPNIADYNAFVTAQATLSPLLPLATWHAIASSQTVNARDNAPRILGIPIYDTQGLLFRLPSADIYTSPPNLESPKGPGPRLNQYGEVIPPDDPYNSDVYVWTGSNYSGTKFTTLPPFNEDNSLGSTVPAYGYDDLRSIVSVAGVEEWLGLPHIDLQTELHHLYALSAPIAVPVPEPSTLVLAAFGFAGLAVWGWRRLRA